MKPYRLSSLLLIFFIVSCHGASVDDISCNYQYVDEGKNSNMLMNGDTVHKTIYGDIVQYEYNSAFILVLQRPNYEYMLKWVSFDLRSSRIELLPNDSEAMAQSKIIADSILRNVPEFKKIFSREYNLYIIDKDSTYGPLDLNEYYIKRTQLGIPNGLYLKI